MTESLDRLRDRCQGALLGMAIGEALGAAGELQAPDGSRREFPPLPLSYRGGTHLAFATALSFLGAGGFDGEHLAATLVAHQEAEPWRGYGSGVLRALALLRGGQPWNDVARHLVEEEEAYGNGAALRATPIGLFFHREPDRAEEAARAAARLTHVHPIGEDGAALQACAVAILVGSWASPSSLDCREFLGLLATHARTRRFVDLLATVGELVEAPVAMAIGRLGTGGDAHESVPASLYAFLRHRTSFAGAVVFAVTLGGDTPSLGSMTGALAGAHLGVGAIPPAWVAALERNTELLDLAARLAGAQSEGPGSSR